MATRRQLGRGILIGATLASLLALGAIITAIVLFDDFVRDKVIEEARKRGVEIEPGDVDVWFGSATIEDCRFRLIGVQGLAGHVERVSVLHADWKPTRFDAENVRLEVVGSAAKLALDVTAWTQAHPQAYRVPVAAKGIMVVWRPTAESAPWLAIQGGHLSDSANGSVFTATKASVAGIDAGAISAAWKASADTVEMSFGGADAASAPFAVVVALSTVPPTATIELRPTPLEQLAGPLGMALPVQGVTASAKTQLVLPATLAGGPVEGQMHAALDGFVPPHPVELNGFIFGNRTTLDTKLAVSADQTLVTLTETVVQAGAFRLSGGGRVERYADHAIVRMDLGGNLACTDVADSAARARIGSVLGRLLGKTAKKVLTGSVAVRVRILADTRNLPAAKVERQIGIGCGLRPLTLEDLIELGLSDEMTELLGDLPSVAAEIPAMIERGLPALPSGLPPLPSALPPIPSALPSIPSGLPSIPSGFPSFRIELPKAKSKQRLADPADTDEPSTP